MSREVDARVVAMYFDNKDFEKNARATIDTLDDLKKNLDIEKSVKGFDLLKKAGESLKLDEISKKAQKLKGVFASLGEAVGKVFNIGTAPLRPLENLFSAFQGYVTKFLGFDLAGKLVNGIEGAVRQLTIAPVSAGWNLYESKMDSIKTIISGTGESLEVVTEHINELNQYANQTVYSFGDMVSNIGKFTNNRVPLEDAVVAMKGIANATADAGQGAQQASMAMYNISQAVGVGSMKMVDWKSLENANIATVRLKETMMEAGVASGKLVKKVEKDAKTGETVTKYYVKGFEKGKKAVEVTAENFRETLNKEWLDKDTMMAAFKIYSGELTSIADLRAMGFSEALGFTDEDLQRMLEVGQAANNAATEVRTFTKMFDALKESVESGWSETFEWIFGNMEEGVNLWSELNRQISEVLEKASEARNAALAVWRGMYKDRNGNWQRQKDVYVTTFQELSEEERAPMEQEAQMLRDEIDRLEQQAEAEEKAGHRRAANDLRDAADERKARLTELENQLYRGKEVQVKVVEAALDGREVLVSSFMELIQVLISLGGAISNAWESVFGSFTSDSMWAFTNGFKDFVDRLKGWLGTAEQADSRLNKITKGLKGLFSILKVVLNFAKNTVTTVIKIFKPLLNIAVDLFGVFGDVFGGIGDMNLVDAINKIGEAFSNLWSKLSGGGWDSVKNKFVEIWESIKGSIKEWANENGLGALVEKFVEIKNALSSKWEEFTGWLESSGIAGFFRDAWEWITKQFKPQYADANGHELKDKRSPVEKFLSDSWDAIKGVWDDLKAWTGWRAIGAFLNNTVAWVSSFFKQKRLSNSEGHELKGQKSPAEEFLTNTWNTIKGIWDDLVAWEGWAAIAEFFNDTVNWVTSFFKPKRRHDENGHELKDHRSPAQKFLGDTWDTIKMLWGRLTSWEGWAAIAEFFNDTVNWVTSFFKPKRRHDENGHELKDHRSPAQKFLGDTWDTIKMLWGRLTGWEGWTAIAEFFRDTVNWVAAFFKPKRRHDENGHELKDHRSPVSIFLQDAWDGIKGVWNRLVAWEGWGAIGSFLGETWTWITSLFGGNKDAAAGSKDPTKAVDQVSEVADSLNGVADKGLDEEKVGLLERIITAISGFWEKISGFAKEVSDKTGLSTALELVRKTLEIFSTILTVIIEFVHKVVVDRDFFANLQAALLLIGGLVGKLVMARWGAKMASAGSEGIGDAILKICLGILAVSAAIALLTKVDQDKMWNAAAVVAAVGTVIAAIIIAIKFKKGDDGPRDETKPWERVLNNLIKWVGIIGLVFVVLKTLPELIASFKESGLSGDDFLKVIGGIAGLIGGVTLIVGLLAKFSNSSGMIKGMAMASVGILAAIAILIVGLGALLTGVGGLSEISEDAEGNSNVIRLLGKGGETLQKIGEGIGGFFGAIAKGFNNAKTESISEQLQNLDEVSSELTPERLTTMARVITATKELAENIPTDVGDVVSYLRPGARDFLNGLETIGQSIAKFGIGMMQGFENEELDPQTALDATIKATEGMSRIARALADFKTAFEIVTKDGKDLRLDADDFAVIGYQYAQAAILISQAIQAGLNNEGVDSNLKISFDATPIIDSIVVALGYGETSIATAVHMMVQAGINKSNNPDGTAGGGYNFSGLFNNGSGVDFSSLFSGQNGENGFTGLIDGNTLFGDGGLQGLLTNAIGDVNTEELSTQFETEFGGMFSMDTLFGVDGEEGLSGFESYMKDFLPKKNENGEFEFDEGFLDSWAGNMDDLGTALDENGVTLSVTPKINYEPLEIEIENYNAKGGMHLNVTPVFDATDLNQGISQIDSFFRDHPILANITTGLPNMTFYSDNYETVGAIRDMDSSVQALTRQLIAESAANVQALDGVRGDIVNISNAVKSLRIYLDTGVLVGVVDDVLGINMLLAGRTGG